MLTEKRRVISLDMLWTFREMGGDSPQAVRFLAPWGKEILTEQLKIKASVIATSKYCKLNKQSRIKIRNSFSNDWVSPQPEVGEKHRKLESENLRRYGLLESSTWSPSQLVFVVKEKSFSSIL